MQIKYISIKGYRSFNDEEGIELKDLKRFNLFIGPNNAGKTNLMRFFLMVQAVSSSSNGKNLEVLFSITPPKSGIPPRPIFGVDDFWDEDLQVLKALVLIDFASSAEEVPIPIWPLIEDSDRGLLLRVTSDHDYSWREGNPLDRKWITIVPFLKTSESNKSDLSSNRYALLIERIKGHLARNVHDKRARLEKWGFEQTGDGSYLALTSKAEASVESLITIIDLAGSRVQVQDGHLRDDFHEAIVNLTRLLGKKMLTIDAIRDHKGQTSINLEGLDSNKPLSWLQIKLGDLNNKSERNKIKNRLLGWLASLVPQVEPKGLDVSTGELCFDFEVGGKTRTMTLGDLGSGVSQVIMLLISLYREKDSPRIVFMDEPENCLHPAAVLAFIDILKKGDDFKKHQFFISTHSNALLDAVDDDFSVHRVTMDKEKGTQMTRCDSLELHHQLLNDLGCRASQIMQTNFVIWVEGPSDRIYIKNWIKALSGDRFIEDKHYAFLTYGGSVLAHLGDEADSVKDPINIFATCRNGCIVMDSDKDQDDDDEKSIVTRIKEQFPNTENLTGVGHWVTAGREIENYIPAELWKEVSAMKGFARKSVKIKGERVNVGLEIKDGFVIGESDDFALKLGEAYKDGAGKELDAQCHAILKRHHDKLKVQMASELAGKWEPENMYMHGLKDQVQQLINSIEAANGMPITRA